MSQAGKVAVVTGSSKGIGYAIAETLVRAGASVAVSARHAEEVSAAAARLNALGKGRALGLPCDVRRPDAVAELIRRTVAEFGGLDILVNNAGVGRFGPVAELSVEHWQQVIETNLSGVFYCCREAIPQLRRRGGGWIINIASLAGKNPLAGGTAYNASKFGLVGFSEALLLDVRNDNIRVSYLMPGSVATHFNDHVPGEADAWKIQPEDIAQVVLDLLEVPGRTMPSRVELRPTRPPRS
ncbi:MAG TPA: SDR family oxidoreductase [Gemmatimonadales bacterium]|jgi:NAD(P)-dependent dehydrogenase (short-subunit alcohol dehydrogenase family)|nr:SDR family oxidoreductase [Gemmatimonadales bacterium]